MVQPERTVEPTASAISLAEVRQQLQIPDDETAFDDELTDFLIPSAIDRVETDAVRALITQTWVLTLQRFPREIELRRPPVQSVTSIVYVDSAGDEQTLATSEYETHFPKNGAGVVRPKWGKVWPTTDEVYNAVRVTFVAGYGDGPDDVPQAARDAIKLAVEEAHKGCDFGEAYWSKINRIGWGGSVYG